MSNSVFVGREAELGKLKTLLEETTQGKTQVIFIAGEAGTGKTSLVNEFIHQTETDNLDVIAAIGECNAQTGISDPYLPFRQILTSLTTEENIQKAASKQDAKIKSTQRWKEFVRVTTATLISLGPDLIGIFVPGARLLVRAGTSIAFNTQLATKLSEKVGKKDTQAALKPNPALDQQKIFEQYTNVLKALSKDQTLVLILDDLQWADSGSISLLFHLVRELKDSHILIIGAYRPDDVALGRDGERHPLESVLNELKRYRGDILIDLSQSEAQEGRAFVEALIDSEPNQLEGSFRDELFAHTGGHPLFTVELLRDLQESGHLIKDTDGNWIQGKDLDWKTLPARIEGVIGERIARLPADLHEIMSVASVFGHEFAAQIVAGIQKVNEREMVKSLSRELEKRYLLIDEVGEIKIGRNFLSQFRFSHVLLQQYLYRELGASERRMLHAEIAESLETVYADQADEIALQLAHHFESAGNDEKAISYLITAGDTAFRAYAQKEAISAYTRALELGEQTDIAMEQLSHIYLNRGRALELNNQYEEALKNYDGMLAAAQEHEDRSMELAAKAATSTLYSTPTPVANASKGQMLSEETLKLARKLGDRAIEAKGLWNLQLVHILQNKASEAIDYGEQSLALARELNLREQMAYVLSDLGWAYNIAGQFDKAGERSEEGAAIWRELGNRPMLSDSLNTSLFRYFWTGKNETILTVAEEVYQISSSIGEIWNQASARNFEGQVWFEYGEIDKSLAALEEAIQLTTQKNRTFETWYRAVFCWIHGELGANDIGKQYYQTHRVANDEVPDTPLRNISLVLYALFEIESGQLDTAANTLQACQPDVLQWEAVLRLAKCKLALARKDFPAGLALADSVIEITRQYKLNQYLPEALFLKGKSYYMLGNPAQAKPALEEACHTAKALGSRRILWQILALLAELETNKETSAALKNEARENVDFIANHITRAELRNAFLKSNGVSEASI